MTDQQKGRPIRSAIGTRSIANLFVLPLLVATTVASAQDVVPPDVLTVSPTGVNISDGTFVFNATDLKIGSLSLERFYQYSVHDIESPPPFGLRMSHNFDIFLYQRVTTTKGPPASTTYFRDTVHIGHSATGTYDIDPYVSPSIITPWNDDAYEGILEHSGGNYVFTDHDATVYTFSPSAVSTVAYANGRTENFTYAGGHLKTVTSNDGYAIVFDYSGAVISAACGFDLSQTFVSSATTCTGAVLKTSYTYSSNDMVSSVDVFGQQTTYADMSCIKPPGYSTCKVSNTFVPAVTPTVPGFQRISQQVMADGSVWQFGGGDPSITDPDYGSDDGSNGAQMIDPNGKQTSFTFTKSSPYSIIDADGRTTQYRYSGGQLYDPVSAETGITQGKMLKQVILPEGNEYDANYDPTHFNLIANRTWKAKPGSGLADRTESYTYPSCDAPNTRQNCVHPITWTDPNGNVTNYVYTSYGSIQSEMASAPTSGAARPLKLYDYVQKYAYIKNASGSLGPAAGPIWLPNSETQCQTAAGSSTPTCDGAAPIIVMTYQYGADGTADNLLLRGKVVTAGGVSLRTCYGYDAASNRIWETAPRAGLASCS